MNTAYPMQNQKTEEICPAVKATDEEIERKANEFEGCLVKNMKFHILSDVCLDNHEHSIPTIPATQCPHSGQKRYVSLRSHKIFLLMFYSTLLITG